MMRRRGGSDLSPQMLHARAAVIVHSAEIPTSYLPFRDMISSPLQRASPLPLVVRQSDDPWTHVLVKHKCHVPCLQAAVAAFRLEHGADMRKSRELREFG